MSHDSEENSQGKKYFVRISDAIGFSDSVTVKVERAYDHAKDTLSISGNYYQVATEIVNKVVTDKSISPQDAEVLREALDEWQANDVKMRKELEEQRAKKDLEGVESIDRKVKDYFENVLKKQELSQATWFDVLNWFKAKPSDEKETKEFSKKSHEELLSIFLHLVGTINQNLISSITHGFRECGIDIIGETVIPKFKFGIQIKSNGDLLASSFTKEIKAQITDSKQYALRGLIIILCGDLTNKKVKDRSRSIVAEVSRYTDDYVKIVPPEQAISIIKMLSST